MSQESSFRSGFVTLVGRPNVGKSTLLNALLKQKVAAVSPRPQTTRRRQLGILTLPQAQIVLMDTPGMHSPRHKLGEFMNAEAADTLGDADAIVWLVDASQPPTPEDEAIAARIAALSQPPPVFLTLNKVDTCSAADVELRRVQFAALLPSAHLFLISAARGQGRDALLQALVETLPEGPPYYDADQITDLYERDIAADLVREAALVLLREEVPHGIAVRIDEYTERSENNAYIAATLFVERDSHKGIVIGKGGDMLKQIGSLARQKIEEMSDRKIFLELRVKVDKNWRDNPDALRGFGYSTDQDS